MAAGTVVGVDGCRAGWFYVREDQQALSYGIARNFNELANLLPGHSRIFVDIPIGLIDRGETARACDGEARKLLGPRRSSIFSPPCRPVLNASTYDEARIISQQSIAKKISKQSFFITPKIREVDEFLLRGNHDMTVREVHPELAFWALNQRQPMVFNKKLQAGFDERLLLLSTVIADAESLVSAALRDFARKDLSRDDIVDALVCLVVARSSDKVLQTLPAAVPRDSKGLAMEIVFTEHPDQRGINQGRADAGHIDG